VLRCGGRANGGGPSTSSSSCMRVESTRVPGTQSEDLDQNRSPRDPTGATGRPHPNQVMRAFRSDPSIRPVSAARDTCAVTGLGLAR
jgi:hypothetical protein